MGNPMWRDPNETTAKRKESRYVQLRVTSADGAEVFFKMRRPMPLALLQEAFCSREKLDQSSVEFLYQGRRISGTSTPDELQMADVDYIEVAVVGSPVGW
eukprot:TRINITY_DN139_c0_g1_i1.p1 TRINITY_DN139_c0_g1~~TRINITY_DN139_c0_g1_i1.p1  ORF type:complete len:116 (-),score=25.63 TRINITY_DN139_c0_g1_i1:643-942(-)